MTLQLLKRPGRYDSLFQVYAEAHGLDWLLLKSQAQAESALDPKAVSRVGAEGLCQFMPQTWREVAGTEADPFNPEHAICAQATYMAALFRQFGDTETSLGAYNWGQGNVRHALREHGTGWLTHAPSETRAYVARILELRAAV